MTVSKPVNNCWQNIKLHFEETNVGMKRMKMGEKKGYSFKLPSSICFVVTQENVQLYVLSV